MPNSGASSARLGSGGASSSRFMQSMPKHVFADWAGAGVGRSSVPSLALPSEQSSKSQAEESPQLQGEALLDRGFGAEAAAEPVPPPRTATDTSTASTQQTSEGDGPADEDGDAVAELPQSPIGGVEGGVHPPPSVTPTAAAPSVMVHAPWQGAAVQDAPKRTAGKVTGAPLLPPPPTGMQRPAASASSIAQFTSAAASTSDVVETEARHTAGSAGAHVPDATGFGVAAPAVSVGVSPMRSRSGTASSLDSGEGSTGSPTARSRRRHLSRHAQKSHQYTTAEQKMERAALPLMLPSAVNGKLVAAPAAAAVPDAPEAAPSTPTPAPPTLVTTEPVRTTTVESVGGLGDGELVGPLPPVHSPMGRAGRQSTTGSDVFSELSDEEAAGHTGEPATPAQSQPRSALGTPASVLGGRHSAMESPAGAAIDMPTQSP
ncbi:unnamed protein product [Symbiodinium sp. KB8]|nr:unnamed protein product [Symbiodinium sp. KB8]